MGIIAVKIESGKGRDIDKNSTGFMEEVTDRLGSWKMGRISKTGKSENNVDETAF